jgi:hypothetical protein
MCVTGMWQYSSEMSVSTKTLVAALTGVPVILRSFVLPFFLSFFLLSYFFFTPICLKRRLRVFGNRVLRGIFGRKRDEMTGTGANFIMRNSMICSPHPVLCG